MKSLSFSMFLLLCFSVSSAHAKDYYGTIQYMTQGVSFLVFQHAGNTHDNRSFCEEMNRNFLRGLRTSCDDCKVEMEGCGRTLPAAYRDIFSDVPGTFPYISAPHFRIVVFGVAEDTAGNICETRAREWREVLGQPAQCVKPIRGTPASPEVELTRETTSNRFPGLLAQEGLRGRTGNRFLDQIYAEEEEVARRQHLNRYGRVQFYNEGTVTIRGLEWMRCSLGQEWQPGPTPSAGTCSGTAVEATWQEAAQLANTFNEAGGFAGYQDWRLPSVTELERLRLCSTGMTHGQIVLPNETSVFRVCILEEAAVEVATAKSVVDGWIFPNTPNMLFWSGSASANHPDRAWYVLFGNGALIEGWMENSAHVRLVRNTQ